MNDNPDNQDVSRWFKVQLNRHGYPFQSAVVAASKNSRWGDWLVEFPVQGKQRSTRIDIVFRHESDEGGLLVSECKRVNPASSNWCFMTRPYSEKGPAYKGGFYFDSVRQDSPSIVLEHAVGVESSAPKCHQGIVVKSEKKGDCGGDSGKDAIEDGVSQLLRGVNGLLHFLITAKVDPRRKPTRFVLIPTLFTTADLFYAEGLDLGEAERRSGGLQVPLGQLQKVEWLWYYYAQTPDLRHEFQTVTDTPYLRDFLIDSLYRESVRPVAVVSGGGIDSFFQETGGWF
jgi:hypothetical protein